MASLISGILESVEPARLRELCVARGLSTGGDQHDKRTRLARSIRGQLDELLPLLLRSELVVYLGNEFTWSSGVSGGFTRVGQASRAELEKLIRRIVEEHPRVTSSKPLGSSSAIRFWATSEEDEDEEDEDDEDEEEEDEDEEEEDEDEEEEGEDEEEEKEEAEEDQETQLDTEFLEWLAEQLHRGPRAVFRIKRLVNELGRYTADQRLTARAVADLASVLTRGGYDTVPDLGAMTRSPGIKAEVSVERRDGSEGDPGAKPDPRSKSALRRDPEPVPPALPPFEQAALRLQFLVQNAAALRKLDESERRRAVELAARELFLGAADQIRLRALAHQFASMHADLGPVVTKLRAVLAPGLRRQLLGDLRELCPPGADIDDLVAVYAGDLDVVDPVAPLDDVSITAPSVSAPRPPPPVDTAPAPIADPVPAPAVEPVVAGGVRSNSLLDSLFDEET